MTLLSINVVVDDAEHKQIQNPHVKAWLDAVKDAAFEAEDLLDEIDIHVSRCKMEADSQSTGKVWSFFNASVSSFDKDIESRMQEILDNLEYLASKKDILGLKEAIGSRWQVSQKLPSTCLLVETVICGRDSDKEIIFDWLISDYENNKQRLSIIAIVGMGGMGKTTLAQHLYNDPRMDGKFDVKVWVCVSEEFDVCRILRAVLASITGSTHDDIEMNTLQVKLKDQISGKRFLLVLDDIWNEDRMQWEALQTPFSYVGQGSKILITTRSKKVVSVTRSNKIHQLEQLEEEHCWKLFAKHAFQDEDDDKINPDLKDIGKKVIKKCQGLPLALKAIGCLLSEKSLLVEWESILASEIWDLPKEDINIIPALILSYHNLPSHLQRCFAYCALFPKDYLFVKEELILLWMAENFLGCPRQSMSVKEVGEQCFNDLLLRSFFQPSREYELHFVMHDLLNDLAKYVCGDFCFTLKVGETQHISKMTRHFSFSQHLHASSIKFDTLYDANRLRTFLPLHAIGRPGGYFPWRSGTSILDLFSKLEFLRVFSLYGNIEVVELPDTIGNLKHLRYLDLSHTRIRKLPDSLCFLYDLQILKLRGCEFLKELPLNLHRLVNLCYLDFSGSGVTKMPMDMGKMKNLTVLSSFYVDKEGSESNIQQLGELNLNGELSLCQLQNVVNPLDAWSANFKSKVHLVKLELSWNANSDNSEKERKVLEMLRPSKYLKELLIYGYGGTLFPDWFGDHSLSNVVFLELSNCKNCVLLPPLGVLPSLKNLDIIGFSGIVMIGSEFYGNESSSSIAIPFPSLETLTFEDLSGWEEWECKVATGAFPRLQKLSISYCPNLKDQLPEKLPSLMDLEISCCEKLVAYVPWSPTIHRLCLVKCGLCSMVSNHPSTLKDFEVISCCIERSFVEWMEHTLSHSYASIESLRIYDCPTMNLPLHFCYKLLVQLRIVGGCDSIRTFPLDLFPELTSLTIWQCSNLEMISLEHEQDLKLTSLDIRECPKFASFPKGGLRAPRLHDFRVCSLEKLKSLPECMHKFLPSLRYATIDDCPQLESFSNGGLPSSLSRLHLLKCSKLLIKSLKWALSTNSSLSVMHITEVDVESFPNQGLLLPSLTDLSIRDCRKLKQLDYEGLCKLPSLKTLFLKNCPNLQCLPEEGFPKSISFLQIKGDCSLLKQRCKKPNGEDWGKISHIERVYIDDDKIN